MVVMGVDRVTVGVGLWIRGEGDVWLQGIRGGFQVSYGWF